MSDATVCTAHDCDRPTDGYLCTACVHLTQTILDTLLFHTRRRGIGPVLTPRDPEAIRDGIDGASYRMDVLGIWGEHGPGWLEDLAVTIAREDAIPYRPEPDTHLCREDGCGRLAVHDGYCHDCVPYLTDWRKRQALISPAARVRDQLEHEITATARTLATDMGWDASVIPAWPATVLWARSNAPTLALRPWAGEALDRLVRLIEQAQRVVDRPDGVIRVDCPRCGSKVPVVPTGVVHGKGVPGVTECNTCVHDGTDEGQRMYGDARWWAEQVAGSDPEAPVLVADVAQAMLARGYVVTRKDVENWVDRRRLPLMALTRDSRGKLRVHPVMLAEVAAVMQARGRRVRAAR